MVIDNAFPWLTQPFRVRLTNDTGSDKLIMKNSVIGVLKPLLSKALAHKLADDQLSDVHVLEPLGNNDLEEEDRKSVV